MSLTTNEATIVGTTREADGRHKIIVKFASAFIVNTIWHLKVAYFSRIGQPSPVSIDTASPQPRATPAVNVNIRA